MTGLTLDTNGTSRMGGATLPNPEPRPSLLDRVIEERHRERSLDDVVSATWQALQGTEAAACLVCGGELEARFGAGARPVGGRCRDCGSELS
jgi:hypothetical protein